MEEIHHHALKLLRRRDYTIKQLREKLESRFSVVPEELLKELTSKRFLDDRRFAENFVARHSDSHPERIRSELEEAGVERKTIDAALAAADLSSLRDVLKARMLVWHLKAPLHGRDAGRLFRALARLGFPEEEIREELEQLHEQ